jgi:hypothetical protein
LCEKLLTLWVTFIIMNLQKLTLIDINWY